MACPSRWQEDWTLTPGLARQQQQVQAALTEIDVTPRRLNDEGVQLELAHLVEGHWGDFDSSPGDDSRLEPASDEEDEDVDADGNMFEYRLKERDLRAECVKEIGEDLFVQVYEYLKVRCWCASGWSWISSCYVHRSLSLYAIKLGSVCAGVWLG